MDNLRRKDQSLALLMSVAFTAGPFGFGVPFKYACISWIVALVSFLYVLWNLDHFEQWGVAIKSAFAILLTAVLVWVCLPSLRESRTREMARATSGDLVPQNDGKDHSGDPPVLQIGPGGQRLPWTGSSDTQVVAYYDKIQMRMVDGKVLLSTTVHDDNKNLIAEIRDNHWIVSSSTAVCWDKNYTDDSLEVKDGHGRVVLQVKLIGNVVQIQEEWQWDPGTKSGHIGENGWYNEKEGIRQLFKYPSELYWGQFRDSPGY